MDYITRGLERKFIRMSEFFKAVLVTGARQVGKTTMLRHLAEGQHEALTRYLDVKSEMEDMERKRIYFRGHTDCFAYLRRIGVI